MTVSERAKIIPLSDAADQGRSAAEIGALLGQSPIGFITADSSYVITEANASALTMLGLRPREAVGLDIADLIGSRVRRMDNEQPLVIERGENIALTRCLVFGPSPEPLAALVSVVAAPRDHGDADAIRVLVSITPTGEIERQVSTDPLTGLSNRRHFDQQAAREFSRLGRKPGSRLSLAVIDIDLFKQVNDRFGHEAGDRVLKEVAATVRRESRDGDTVARFGGEEFVVFMPETDIDGAFQAAERIRQAVAKCAIALRHDDNIVPYRPTVSIGIATVVSSVAGSEFSELFGRADSAMYAAKDAGRNRTAQAREPAGSTER